MSDERTPELNIDEKYSERLEYLGRIAALEGLLREALGYIPTYKGNETGSANFANRVREVLKGKYDD